MGIYNLYFKNKIQLYGEEFVSGSADIMQSTQEVAGGMKEIKIMGAEIVFFRTFSQAAKKIANGQIGLNVTSILPRSILELFLIVFIVGMITKDIILNQDIAPTLILLGTFAAAMVRILPLISQLQSSVNTINYHHPSVHKLAEIIRLNGIDLSEKPEKLDSQSNSLDAFNAENMFRQLKLDNISYTYPNSSKASIRSVNIEINKGDYIGIVGPSGAGKTTLIDIILGFLKPTTGSLKLNNNDAHHNIKKLRLLCAYIPQDIFLINGTLKENITMQNSDICNEKMANVIKSSNLEDLLHDLPDGIDTDLGDKGVRLSGGQKQRVSIARALYFDREILVMDESTSALDSKTEKIFIDKLVKLKKKKTIISIAHRVSTLKNCNKIYTVNNGQVAGPYTYDEIK
jgi:ABC-type bacteriocin/lantibiotic exporter with double-glycine peptidase domain